MTRPDPELLALSHKRDLKKAAAVVIAEYGPGVTRRRIADFARVHHSAAERLYASESDIMADLMSDTLWSLNDRVGAAFDQATSLGPIVRLEAVIEAWLRHVAEQVHAHRSFHLALHLLPEHRGSSLRSLYQAIQGTLKEALCAPVPGLAERPPETIASLLDTARILLSDATWPQPSWGSAIHATARRMCGMLLAAARAECEGDWPELGPTTGVSGKRLRLESTEARRLMRIVLDMVAQGGEVTLTRRGRRVAKVVAAA